MIEIAGERIEGILRTYGDRPPGTLIALVGSSGWVEVAVVNGDAARQLTAGAGTTVWLRRRDRLPEPDLIQCGKATRRYTRLLSQKFVERMVTRTDIRTLDYPPDGSIMPREIVNKPLRPRTWPSSGAEAEPWPTELICLELRTSRSDDLTNTIPASTR